METMQLQAALSARESEVLALIARGCKNSEFALALDVQERTVRFHVENILDKLNMKNRTEAVCFAFGKGWIKN